MKKTGIILMLAAVFALTVLVVTSCSDKDDNNDIETVIVTDNLPEVARNFISTYYPQGVVQKVVQDVDNGVLTYEVFFANGHDVTFNRDGAWIDVDAPTGQMIPDGIVPTAIQTFINNNYPGVGVNEIEIEPYGYEVELVNGLDLKFGPEGNLITVNK